MHIITFNTFCILLIVAYFTSIRKNEAGYFLEKVFQKHYFH